MADRKTYFRKILTDSRAALSQARVATTSDAVQKRLLRLPAYDACTTVVLYSAKDNEIRTEVIFADALRSGRRVLFPRIVRERQELSLICVSDREDLKPGAFGLLEPTGAEIVQPATLERALICVPGVAFSPVGQRLGHGGGYYDRMVAAASPRAITAGLAYSFQVLDRLPESPGDRRLDIIVTESAIHPAGNAQHAAVMPAGQGGVPRC